MESTGNGFAVLISFVGTSPCRHRMPGQGMGSFDRELLNTMEQLEAKTNEKRWQITANSSTRSDTLEDEPGGWFLGREPFFGSSMGFLCLLLRLAGSGKPGSRPETESPGKAKEKSGRYISFESCSTFRTVNDSLNLHRVPLLAGPGGVAETVQLLADLS